jgi:hypothetical protein
MLTRARTALALLSIALLPLAGQAGSSAAPAAADQVGLLQAPAKVGGLWCGAGLLHEFSLDIVQQYQDVQGRLVRKNRVREITGHVEGARVRTDPQRNESMELLAQDNQLRIIGATGVLALATGQFFTRAVGGSCTH